MVEVVVMLRAAITMNQGTTADLGADSRLAGNLARLVNSLNLGILCQ